MTLKDTLFISLQELYGCLWAKIQSLIRLDTRAYVPVSPGFRVSGQTESGVSVCLLVFYRIFIADNNYEQGVQ